jgi:hypothetical protein
MSNRPQGPVPTACRRLAIALLGLAAATGCSDGPTSVQGQGGGGTPHERATPPHATLSLSSQAANAAAAARPNGEATCSLLPAARARAVLGGDVDAGTKDRRKSGATRTQVDGCLYTAKTGARLSYLVWEVPTTGSKDVVREGLPPAHSGARDFDPKIGGASAGAVVVTGPMTVAHVNVVSNGRLMQVSVVAKDSATAREAATAAAAALVKR